MVLLTELDEGEDRGVRVRRSRGSTDPSEPLRAPTPRQWSKAISGYRLHLPTPLQDPRVDLRLPPIDVSPRASPRGSSFLTDGENERGKAMMEGLERADAAPPPPRLLQRRMSGLAALRAVGRLSGRGLLAFDAGKFVSNTEHEQAALKIFREIKDSYQAGAARLAPLALAPTCGCYRCPRAPAPWSEPA